VNGAIPPEHPDDDLLADLAADVLPTHQARAVEAHVMVCRRCTQLLTDSAQVRELLLADDPGPVPPDVLARIDQALRIEAAGRDGATEYPPPAPPGPPVPVPTPPAGGHDLPRRPRSEPPVKPPVRVISPWEDTTTIEAFEVARKRRAAVSRRPGADDDATATSAIATPRGRGPRLTRPSRGPSRSRRDLRQDVRDLKVGRRGMVLSGAAAVVVLLGLGVYVVVGLLGNRETGAATSASSVEAAGKAPVADAAGGPPVLTTGTNYSDAALAAQARALVGQVSHASGSAAMARTPAAAAPSPTVSAEMQAPAAADAGNLDLRNPAALNGCLAALQTGGRRPVAVDLAKYDGRDAAIIVLDGVNGGYEVWAVARDCRPGADGTINYILTP
jgi:hypothetical protein